VADDPIDLIRRFEPILHFHKDERFFPSDAKRYMEHCALWDVKGPPFDDKARWNGTSPRTLPHFPRIPRGKLIVLDGEKPVKLETTDGIPGKVLGEPGLVYLNLLDTAEDERFLDLAGWVDGYGVTRTSINRYTDLNEIADLYNRDNQALMDSRFWYHAELFNASRLRGLADASSGITLDKFTKLTDPALLCYYLFFQVTRSP
jgi:hypothetical protein